MSYHYLFALNHQAIADYSGPEPLDTLIGKIIADFSSDVPEAWCPKDYALPGESVLLKRLALYEYDIHTVAIEVNGFSFERVLWERFQGCNRETFAGLLSGGSLAAPPDAGKIIEERLAAFRKDPVAAAIAQALQPPTVLSKISDSVASIYTIREEVVALLQDTRSQNNEPLRTQTGAAVLDAAANANAKMIPVEGINRTPAIRKAIIVHTDMPSVCVWVFNGLHLVEDFDERCWGRLETLKHVL